MPSFFEKARTFTVSDILEIVGIDGHPDAEASDIRIENIAPIHTATKTDITFIDNPKYVDQLDKTGAAICLCGERYMARMPDHVMGLKCGDPYRAFAKISSALYPTACRPQSILADGTISELAYVSPSAELEENVTVEPGVVIGDHANIGSGTRLLSGARVGQGVKIGRDVTLGPSVSVEHAYIGDRVILHAGVRVGQDGFGFAMSAEGHLKVPQVGRVIVQDDVEIGANTTIDRGANRDTIIGEGSKIDNQVQIGHNVVLGRHCIIVAQVGISGSTTLEDFVVIGGQTGVNGHVTIGMGAQIAAVSVVHGDVPPGARWGGVPAKPVKDWFREQQALKKLAKKT